LKTKFVIEKNSTWPGGNNHTLQWTHLRLESSSDGAEKTLNYNGKPNCRQHPLKLIGKTSERSRMHQSCIVRYVPIRHITWFNSLIPNQQFELPRLSLKKWLSARMVLLIKWRCIAWLYLCSQDRSIRATYEL